MTRFVVVLFLTSYFPRVAWAIECLSCPPERRAIIEAACPPVPPAGWSYASPFGVPPAALSPALRNFCLLTSSAPIPVGAFPIDNAVVFPQAAPFAPSVWHDLRGRFHHATGWLPTHPLGALPPHRVDLAIIDDAVNRPNEPGRPGDGVMKHGRAVGLIAEELTCPSGQGGNCAVKIYNHQALGCDGGRSGTRSGLARAIYQSVRAWKARPQPSRLVINLSVGFEEDENEAATALVQAAIQDAVCHGALVIAAAGNLNPDGSGVEPLYPGKFESIPTSTSCASYFDGNSVGFVATLDPQPLVHAAGGVGAFDDWSPIPTTRPLAHPRLATAAFHAVAHDASNVPSNVLSGTSVSAAVVSAIAAVVWSYLPSLEPLEVVDTIWDSGVDLGTDSDFGISSPIHMVDLCRALQGACSASSAPECTQAALLSCPTLNPTHVPWPVYQLDGVFGGSNTCVHPAPNAPLQCTPFFPGTPDETCPVLSTSAVGPQPGELGCSACNINVATDALYVAIDSDFIGTARPVKVMFQLQNGSAFTIYSEFQGPIMDADDILKITLFQNENNETIPSNAKARLHYQIATGEEYTTAIAW